MTVKKRLIAMAITLACMSGVFAKTPPLILAESKESNSVEKYFDLQEIRDENTLGTKIISDTVINSKSRPGKTVRKIELSFTAQNWHGLILRHPARVYVPVDYKGGGKAGIIGTERQFFDDPNWSRKKIPGSGRDTEGEYAEGTAIDLNIPIMIFSNPAEDYWGMNESDLMGYALKKAQETKDLTWVGYYPIIKSYLRAITLMHSLKGINTEKAVLMGCSKRGLAVSVATGVDPDRVAGTMAACYFGGNNLYFIARKFAEFGAGVGGGEETMGRPTGPAFQPADELLREVNNPIGLQILANFDPYMWRTKIKAKYLVTLGTNDQLFALGSPNSMMSEMTGDKAFLAVDNFPHTWVSDKHLAAWRMWLAHTFMGRKVPEINMHVSREHDTLTLQPKINKVNKLIGVSVFYAYVPLVSDWRKAKWQSAEIPENGGNFTVELKLKPGNQLAYYIEVQDEGVGGTGYVSSLVEIVRQ
ncbi:PhoPQ-activated protein PqaA family protein [Serratia sp. FDAARGOS_506]|uniref:PhoPQ-activated protein PqaA family protein n=1 Tax=Serratia sp. FDAARGOS_506 TaxID=2420306 RepID=UPI001C12B993|nr:PhoPQ-activated protein PqaA family protein [Serratia sp. FDAARGOS_506]